jgi:putative addiction module component (TIGR02574 family)
MAQAAEILEAALQLDEDERTRLVEALAASLYGNDLGKEWEDEIQRRIEDIDSEAVATVSGDEVFARLEQRFGGR